MKSLPAEFLAWGPWLVLCRSRLLQDVVGGGGVGSSIPSQGEAGENYPWLPQWEAPHPSLILLPLPSWIQEKKYVIPCGSHYHAPWSPTAQIKPKLTPPRDCWPPQGTPAHICPLPITTHPPCAKISRLPAKMKWMRAPTTVLMCKAAAGARRHRVCPESPTQKYKVAPQTRTQLTRHPWAI